MNHILLLKVIDVLFYSAKAMLVNMTNIYIYISYIIVLLIVQSFWEVVKGRIFFRFLKPLMIYLPKFKTKYNPNGCYDNKRKSILRTITLILLCQFYDSQNVKMTIPSQHTYVSKRLKALSLPGYRSEGSPHYNDEDLVSLVLWVSIDNVLGRVFHNDTGLCNRSFIVPWNL